MTGLSFWNAVVGIGTLLILATVIIVWIMEFLGERRNRLFKFLARNHFHLSFLIALSAVVGSLTYSNVFGFLPCEFCWWIRICMYPQLVVLGLGIWQKDVKIWMSSVILSVIGLAFSVYLVLLQNGIVGSDAACVQAGVSCAKIDVIIFGWLTIPIMALIFFLGTLTFAHLAHNRQG